MGKGLDGLRAGIVDFLFLILGFIIAILGGLIASDAGGFSLVVVTIIGGLFVLTGILVCLCGEFLSGFLIAAIGSSMCSAEALPKEWITAISVIAFLAVGFGLNYMSNLMKAKTWGKFHYACMILVFAAYIVSAICCIFESSASVATWLPWVGSVIWILSSLVLFIRTVKQIIFLVRNK